MITGCTGKKMNKVSLSVIVATMNRTERLKIILDTWARIPFVNEIIVVDWSSTPPVYDDEYIRNYINNSNKVKLIIMQGQPYFKMSASYNLAYDFCNKKNSHLCKIDVDFIMNDYRILESCTTQAALNRPLFFTGDWVFDPSFTGFCLMKMKDFCMYNEDMIGWGRDDVDLYNRLQHNGLTRIIIPGLSHYITHMFHDDNARTANSEIKDKEISNKNNKSVEVLNYKRKNQTYTILDDVKNKVIHVK